MKIITDAEYGLLLKYKQLELENNDDDEYAKPLIDNSVPFIDDTWEEK